MLHALPAVLDELEQRLIAGADPLPLLAAVRWADIVGWPQSPDEARALKRRLGEIKGLVAGLQAPLRATLQGLRSEPAYTLKGLTHDTPISFGALPEQI